MSCRAGLANVALVNLGCRVNRVELDSIANKLEAAGYVLTGEAEADVIVINTCAVTGEAEAKTRKAIRHAASRPRSPLVVVTGCVASLFSDELAALADNVEVVANKREVADYVIGRFGSYEAEPAAATDVHLTVTPTGRTRPGVQVQDGCDNRCTYCIIWKARGAARSFDPAGIIDEVRAAMARGAHEVVLTGINLGDYRWAVDGGEMRLPGLIDHVLAQTGVERLRLSSIEPPDVDGELLRAMAAAGSRVAPFLHICLQSGCDETLRRMARVYRTDLFARACEQARGTLPNVALGTDLIVGFPGETDEQFEESLAFCEHMRFAKMHIFRYSRRPGTPAAGWDCQVDSKVMAERSRRAHELADRMRIEEASRLVGTDDLVLVQYPGRGVSGGLFDVEVDPSVAVDTLLPVRLTDMRDDGTLRAAAL
ncbi:tRNA (N(6)-L-threonylcarbamoyladenosine(37)-C(2))-methylthiotransferase MtaB [Paratractidigestivibacter sp.]|uniref:tRNA (N(6)-L-threonylcarbamoyladenosine(37)-C(2))- methylthiotransferase MtaB n=1 Tax=Paratractidigestivibacter sp. TaxID=2847316 RepID=UPI002ABD9127|nr:tRNA (N(6)-L-threonylcarbamoyladenosine(37)-C(2))-methylthiotransferase MtaB [Paratractidigestivibacter sp.]